MLFTLKITTYCCMFWTYLGLKLCRVHIHFSISIRVHLLKFFLGFFLHVFITLRGRWLHRLSVLQMTMCDDACWICWSTALGNVEWLNKYDEKELCGYTRYTIWVYVHMCWWDVAYPLRPPIKSKTHEVSQFCCPERLWLPWWRIILQIVGSHNFIDHNECETTHMFEIDYPPSCWDVVTIFINVKISIFLVTPTCPCQPVFGDYQRLPVAHHQAWWHW